MNLFTWVFLLALASNTFLEYWLLWRQRRFVNANRNHVPESFSQQFSLPQHQKAADYTLANIVLGKTNLFFNSILLLLWTLGGGLAWLDGLWQRIHWTSLIQGAGLVLSVLIISTILELPLSLWRTFGIEQRFGFNRTTPKRFATDMVLQLVLMLAVGMPLVTIILWLMQQAGSYWWLWAWAVWTGFTLFISWAYPTFIAPMFNKFEPLNDPELQKQLNELLAQCGFRNNGIYVMDGSKRSSHGNAYFTGFGKNKRIVFFDTLLKSLNNDEITAVLAHELGHFKRHHILKTMFIMSLISLLGMALLGWLIEQNWFYQGLGISHMSPAIGLTLFLLVIPVFASFFTPWFSAMSRRHEFEADAFAADHSDANALISALLKMYRDNASTLTPDPLYSAFHHSHPPASERIRHLSSKIGISTPSESPS